jgi:hypothetical protein
MHIDSPRESSPFLRRSDAPLVRGALLFGALNGMGPRLVRLGPIEGGINEHKSSSKTESH